MIQEILNEVLGNKNIAQYVAAFFFIFLGVLVSIRASATSRSVESDATPAKFSYKFLTLDNFSRAVSSIAISFAFIRFGEDITGREFTYFGVFLLGIGFDQAVAYLNKWQSGIRDKFKENK